MNRRRAAAAVATLALALLNLAAPAAVLAGGPAQSQQLQLRGLRGATTAKANTVEAIRAAVQELMGTLITDNQLQAEQVVSATFTATADLDALFPASVARRLPGWQDVALLDMQQLAVSNDLPRCIRVLLLVWMPASQRPVHVYLAEAERLRPDRLRRPASPDPGPGAGSKP